VSPEVTRAENVARELSRAARLLAGSRHGALMVLERETGLHDLATESGVPLHADLRAELLVTIFYRGTALHDGAVLISGDRIIAAGVLLPLSQNVLDSERYGTRHRAAIGISEQTDALVVVVSEETGSISLGDARPHRAQSQRGEAAPPHLQHDSTAGSAARRAAAAANARGTLGPGRQGRAARRSADRPRGARHQPAAQAAWRATGGPGPRGAASLMRWLVRLVAAPGMTCLDPFAGSGTTGVACIAEGVYFIGIEREVQYATEARQRLEAVQPALAASG